LTQVIRGGAEAKKKRWGEFGASPMLTKFISFESLKMKSIRTMKDARGGAGSAKPQKN